MSGLVLASYARKEYRIKFGSLFPNGLLSQLSRRDLRIFVIALATILGYPFYGLIAVGLLAHLSVFVMLPHGLKDTLDSRRPDKAFVRPQTDDRSVLEGGQAQ